MIGGHRRPGGWIAPMALALAVALSVPASDAAARQLLFSRQVADGGVQYRYSFNDAEGQVRTLKFTLDEALVQRGHREYRPIDSPEVAASLKRRVTSSIEEYIRPLGGSITVDVQRKRGSLSVHYEVKLPPNRAVPAVEAEVERRAESAMAETYANYFNVRDPKGTEVRPDFARIVQRYVEVLKPIADGIAAETKTDRERIAMALAFVQTIPYAVLERRNQGGFVMPTAFFDLNRGDCDVKSVALAAILMSLVPDRSLVLVLPQEHALLAIDIPSEGDEAKLVVDGRSYVLVEPTGPALWPIGRVAGDTGKKMAGTTSEVIVLPRPAPELTLPARKPVAPGTNDAASKVTAN